MYRIFISTYGKPILKIRNGVALEVGASDRETLYSLKDNTGDNISKENAFYGELTGLYWIWKNGDIAENDIVGFCHYNKALKISPSKAINWLRKNPKGIITLTPLKIRNHPISYEIKCLVDILKRKYPDCYLTWNKFYDEEGAARGDFCRGGNMFITTGVIFNYYCSWLFDILQELKSLVGESVASPNMKRYCAFMGERLLSVFVETYSVPVLGVDMRYKKWWLPYVRRIIGFLCVNKDNCIYKFLRKYFGYSSQYGRKE